MFGMGAGDESDHRLVDTASGHLGLGLPESTLRGGVRSRGMADHLDLCTPDQTA